jgi:hypothetical protein
VAGATPFPKVGWPDHPIFGQGVASATPIRPVWGGRSHLRPLGVVRPPQKAQKKKKNERMRFGLWGWPDHPLGPGGGFRHPLPAVGGGFGHLHALGGGPATPKGQNPFSLFFFFFFWPFGVAGPPPKAWGGFGHPHTADMGWPKPPLGQKWGGPATPIYLFFFFFFFQFPSFKKKKKKKKKPKMQNYAVFAQTASFWTSPKRRSFGVEGSLDNLPPKGS